MSNEPKHPKYSFNSLRGCFYDGEKLISIPDACTELNRLESDVEHSEVLRNAFDRLLSNEVEHRRKLESEVERLKGERDNAVKMCDSIYKVDKREIEKLQSDLARCKAERLGAEEVDEYLRWVLTIDLNDQDASTSITAFRASQTDKTQEGKG